MDDLEKLEAAKELTPLIDFMQKRGKPLPIELLLPKFSIKKEKFLKWMKNDEIRHIFEQKQASICLDHIDMLMNRVAETKPEFLLKTTYSHYFQETPQHNLLDEATRMTEEEALLIAEGKEPTIIDVSLDNSQTDS
jgi:hypothetical protein